MQIAVLLYDRFTALDAVGPYEVFNWLPGAELVLVAEKPGPIANDAGTLQLVATAGLEDVTAPDVVIVPGGPDQTPQLANRKLLNWLRTVDRTTTWTTSVCTGSLILAGAGLLTGRRASTHWLAVDQLADLGATPSGERVVFDDKYVTAAGVSAGIDMALALVGRMTGDGVAQAIQLGIEYDPRPPYQAGSPETAPKEIVELVRASLGNAQTTPAAAM